MFSVLCNTQFVSYYLSSSVSVLNKRELLKQKWGKGNKRMMGKSNCQSGLSKEPVTTTLELECLKNHCFVINVLSNPGHYGKTAHKTRSIDQ